MSFALGRGQDTQLTEITTLSLGTAAALRSCVEHARWTEEPDLEKSGERRAWRSPARMGRYLVSPPIAHGGMGSVHLTVVADDPSHLYAVKRIHPHLAADDYYTRMLLDENAIGSAIQHPNVIGTYGGELVNGEMFLLMEYVAGASLTDLMRASGGALPPLYAAAIMAGVLRGLHAAHEAVDSRGQSLGIVHRDVSPQNVMVGVDGVPRILDFGIASASRRAQSTRAGTLKGKLAYMAPEQVIHSSVDRRIDVYAAGVVLWEALTGRDLFQEENDAATLARLLENKVIRPSAIRGEVSRSLDAIVLRATSRDPNRRYATALEMAQAIEHAVLASNPVTPEELGAWVAELAEDVLARQEALLCDLRGSRRSRPSPPPPRLELEPPRVSQFRVEEAEPGSARGDIALVLALVLSSGLAGALAMHLSHVLNYWR